MRKIGRTTYHIAVIKGDGIGPEIVTEAMKILHLAGEKFGFLCQFHEVLAGGCAIEATGQALPEETLEACLASDSVLLGAVGGPQWDTLPGEKRPERALLGLRSGLDLFTNLRPAYLQPALAHACPLKPEIVGEGMDILIVRELTGGIYFGKRGRTKVNGAPAAFDTECYSVPEIQRICRVAFESARKRRGHVTSVDKANVLESSRLWRTVFHEIAREYPDVTADDMFIDNAAMQLVHNPAQFDVIVTTNMFGDILSDEASMLTGSIGMLPSASLGATRLGMYEPVHGSAPDIAGKGLANPLATIASAAMMLRYSLDQPAAADAVDRAIAAALGDGWRTADIADASTPEDKTLSTAQMGEAVASLL